MQIDDLQIGALVAWQHGVDCCILGDRAFQEVEDRNDLHTVVHTASCEVVEGKGAPTCTPGLHQPGLPRKKD